MRIQFTESCLELWIKLKWNNFKFKESRSKQNSRRAFNSKSKHIGITKRIWTIFQVTLWNIFATCTVFPVSGVMPSMVRMISNVCSAMSLALMAYSGDLSSILWLTTTGQNIWKKSWLPSISTPNSMEIKWYGISCTKSKIKFKIWWWRVEHFQL